MKAVCTLIVALAVAAPAAAQTGAAQTGNAMAQALKQQLEIVKGNIVKSAEKVSEDVYAFKPAPEVRSFGQILGHIADANQMLCSIASGSKAPAESVEKTKTTKADLQKAIADSFAACDAAFASMTDAKAMEKVKFFGMEQPRLAVLAFNTAHDFEHYGNLVTYMRAKGIVPPSSEKQAGSQ
jgi:uncharacterized damage-inducible protein DinB